MEIITELNASIIRQDGSGNACGFCNEDGLSSSYMYIDNEDYLISIVGNGYVDGTGDVWDENNIYDEFEDGTGCQFSDYNEDGTGD